MAIPFIRGYPGSKRVLQEIARPAVIEAKAAEFIGNGGRYLVEILDDGQAHLMAIIDVVNTATLVAEQTVENGPKLLVAVDRLVRESVKHIPGELLKRLLVPAQHVH